MHLHDASRRHYDLRLQVGGTLESFAVPKGPSLNSRDKRLAIHTEDHPLEYLDFEEVIPEGNYGGGPMIVWDTGRVRYLEGTAEEGVARGKIDFELSGFKLNGRFALVETSSRRPKREQPKQAEWLLLKKTDAHSSAERDIVGEEPRSVLSGLTVEELAERAAVAERLCEHAAELGAGEGELSAGGLTPMLCALDGAGLSEADRFYELKLDGVRIVADKQGERVVLRYRSGQNATASYPEIARAVRALPVDRVVLDGEIVAFDERGRPSFQRLGPRIHARRAGDVVRVAGEVPVVYLVFDVLALGSRVLTGLPLVKRKDVLMRLVRGKGLVRALDHLEGEGGALFDLCEAEHLEGVVAKRANSPYRPGPRRTDDWVKLKCTREDEFVVVGWAETSGSGKGLGAVCLASYEGEQLVYRGRVGSGLHRSSIRALEEQLAPLGTERCAAVGELPPGRYHFTRPELVVSVRFQGFSDDGHLRAPVFRGIRPDKHPAECRVAPPGELGMLPAELPEPASSGAGRVVVTNRDKVFWPNEGYTKGDLVEYYAGVADVMLPFLHNRPVVLVRYPDGILGKSFYQWNVPAGTPSWLRTLGLFDEQGDENKHVFLIDDADSLRFVANLGAIPIHVLASREQSPKHCDFLTVDLDIGRQPFARAVELALSLRELLNELGLQGYPKTSGQKGLHVLVPLGPGVGFETAKLLVELLGRLLVERHPKTATMERRVSKRGSRVYVDTGQTGRSRTIVAPYSVRAHPGATVSTPLLWDEVHAALDPARFTMLTVPMRVAELGDPMAGLLDATPDIARAVQRLEQRLG